MPIKCDIHISFGLLTTQQFLTRILYFHRIQTIAIEP